MLILFDRAICIYIHQHLTQFPPCKTFEPVALCIMCAPLKVLDSGGMCVCLDAPALLRMLNDQCLS